MSTETEDKFREFQDNHWLLTEAMAEHLASIVRDSSSWKDGVEKTELTKVINGQPGYKISVRFHESFSSGRALPRQVFIYLRLLHSALSGGRIFVTESDFFFGNEKWALNVNLNFGRDSESPKAKTWLEYFHSFESRLKLILGEASHRLAFTNPQGFLVGLGHAETEKFDVNLFRFSRVDRGLYFFPAPYVGTDVRKALDAELSEDAVIRNAETAVLSNSLDSLESVLNLTMVGEVDIEISSEFPVSELASLGEENWKAVRNLLEKATGERNPLQYVETKFAGAKKEETRDTLLVFLSRLKEEAYSEERQKSIRAQQTRTRIALVKDVLCIFLSLATRGVIHRDWKPHNFTTKGKAFDMETMAALVIKGDTAELVVRTKTPAISPEYGATAISLTKTIHHFLHHLLGDALSIVSVCYEILTGRMMRGEPELQGEYTALLGDYLGDHSFGSLYESSRGTYCLDYFRSGLDLLLTEVTRFTEFQDLVEPLIGFRKFVHFLLDATNLPEVTVAQTAMEKMEGLPYKIKALQEKMKIPGIQEDVHRAAEREIAAHTVDLDKVSRELPSLIAAFIPVLESTKAVCNSLLLSVIKGGALSLPEEELIRRISDSALDISYRMSLIKHRQLSGDIIEVLIDIHQELVDDEYRGIILQRISRALETDPESMPHKIKFLSVILSSDMSWSEKASFMFSFNGEKAQAGLEMTLENFQKLVELLSLPPENDGDKLRQQAIGLLLGWMINNPGATVFMSSLSQETIMSFYDNIDPHLRQDPKDNFAERWIFRDRFEKAINIAKIKSRRQQTEEITDQIRQINLGVPSLLPSDIEKSIATMINESHLVREAKMALNNVLTIQLELYRLRTMIYDGNWNELEQELVTTRIGPNARYFIKQCSAFIEQFLSDRLKGLMMVDDPFRLEELWHQLEELINEAPDIMPMSAKKRLLSELSQIATDPEVNKFTLEFARKFGISDPGD